ncbi:hypothetical protein WMF26_06900 [Sorangium sp. So ce185]|uniref:hypothetical protein n=1 Tax=Sorangium sp. So ce185 TaxID=3133287 RepID=UPI003F60D60C
MVLSTADWVRGISGSASDSWIFEPWRIDSGDDDHIRVGKFSVNLTDSGHDRLYPDPYTRFVRLNVLSTANAIRKLSPLLTADDAASRAKLTALWHLYLARRDAPYFGSPFEDLEAVWSAFEAWYRLPKSTGYRDDSPYARFLREWTPRAVARRLRNGVWERRPRSALVYDGVSQSLHKILDARIERDLSGLIDELYALRSEQTHGGAPERERLRREEQDAHVLGLAFAVWRYLIEYELFEDNIFVAGELASKLRDTFLERSIYDRLLQAFDKTDRKDWCDDTGVPSNPDMVASCRGLFQEVLDITVVPRRYRHTTKARDARRKALLVLSAWMKAAATKDPTTSNERPIVGLLQEISSAAATYKKQSPDKMDDAMVKALLRRNVHEEDSFDAHLLAKMGDLAGIHFPTWCRLIVRLHELASGYQLM